MKDKNGHLKIKRKILIKLELVAKEQFVNGDIAPALMTMTKINAIKCDTGSFGRVVNINRG